METVRIIPIFNQGDVHAARMYTREAARQLGMELIEQAQVSLATSSLAECLKKDERHSQGTDAAGGSSQVIIEFLNENSQSGVQISFSCPTLEENNCIHQQIEKVRPLVDEIRIEHNLAGSLQVVLVKWCSGAAANEARLNHEITGNG